MDELWKDLAELLPLTMIYKHDGSTVILSPTDASAKSGLLASFANALHVRLERISKSSPSTKRCANGSGGARASSGRKRVEYRFPNIGKVLQEFVDTQSTLAQEKRRDSTSRLISARGGESEGFWLRDAQK